MSFSPVQSSPMFSRNEAFETLSTKLINILMKDGKKARATRLLTQAYLYLNRRLTVRDMKQKKHMIQRARASSHTSTQTVNLTVQRPPSVSKVLLTLFSRLRPCLSLKTVKRGRKVFPVPFPLPESAQVSFVFRWLHEGAQYRQGRYRLKGGRPASFAQCFGLELFQTYTRQSGHAYYKRKQLYKLADRNRQFLWQAR
jgi:ribosomal protein S7